MRCILFLTVLSASFATALPASAQATREELTLKKPTRATTDPPELELPTIASFKYNPNDFSTSTITPDLFLSLVEITTVDFRRYRNMQVHHVVFDYNDGSLVRLEVEPPEIKAPREIFVGAEILTAVFKDRNGRRRYYVHDERTAVLRPASRHLFVSDEIVKKADRERLKLSLEYGEEVIQRKPPEYYEK